MGRRAELSEEQKIVERRRAKERELAKARGQGGLVDATPMQSRIRKLHDVHEVTFDRISERTGVDLACIKWHYQGFSFAAPDRPLTTCQWRIHNAVMTTTFGPADVRRNVGSTGTLRRLQALVAAGYPQRWLANETGRVVEHLNAFLVKEYREVDREHAAAVEQVYRKYAETDPLTVGVPSRNVAYARTVARKHRWPGPECWDQDTIDDPNAVPEYTGACGTPEGYRIHVRETIFEKNPIPLCGPCRESVETRPPTDELFVFNRHAFAQALTDAGTNPRRLARAMYGDHLEGSELRKKADAIYRWRDGSRAPRSIGLVQRIAGLLNVSVTDLVDQEATSVLRSRPLIGHGKFNPYVMRAAVEMAGLTFSKVGEMCGVSSQMASKWARGEGAPAEPEKLDGLASYLGVDRSVFYQ